VRDICAIFDMDKEYDKAVKNRITEATLTKSDAYEILLRHILTTIKLMNHHQR
jgi:hypothetical protein